MCRVGVVRSRIRCEAVGVFSAVARHVLLVAIGCSFPVARVVDWLVWLPAIGCVAGLPLATRIKCDRKRGASSQQPVTRKTISSRPQSGANGRTRSPTIDALPRRPTERMRFEGRSRRNSRPASGRRRVTSAFARRSSRCPRSRRMSATISRPTQIGSGASQWRPNRRAAE